jgi:hypothetical protein
VGTLFGMARLSPRIPEIKVAGRTEITVARKQNRRAGPGHKMQRPPFAKLTVLGVCVSLLAALFLAAAPDFQPDELSIRAQGSALRRTATSFSTSVEAS